MWANFTQLVIRGLNFSEPGIVHVLFESVFRAHAVEDFTLDMVQSSTKGVS